MNLQNIDGREEGRNMFGDCCLIDITIRPGTADWTNISENQTTIYGDRVPTVKSFTDLIVEKIEEDELMRLNTPKPPSTWVRCRRQLGAWLNR